MSRTSERVNELYTAIRDSLRSVIVGQDEVIDFVIITMLCNSHSIIVGVPGLAKTLLVRILSASVGLDYNRIQFTPDLMPSDITGTVVLEKESREFKFVKGPVFTNILLADEINRTPPKTQSALLQAMEERTVSVEGKHYDLPVPFNVFATQNPIEQEGTYPLPEAQLDRFMFQINISYPGSGEEMEIISNRKINEHFNLKKPSINRKDIISIQEDISNMPVGSNITKAIVNMLRNSRPETSELGNVKSYLRWGASPRAGIYMQAAAKTRALLNGRLTPDMDDVRSVAHPVLRHRLILSFKGEMENANKEEIIDEIIAKAD